MDKKKLAAITAAVFQYIKTEEDAALAPSSFEQDSFSSGFVNQQKSPNIWGFSGRSAQMNMRSMMQMRAFK